MVIERLCDFVAFVVITQTLDQEVWALALAGSMCCVFWNNVPLNSEL